MLGKTPHRSAQNLYAFEKRDQIGEGAYGVVYRARSLERPNKLVAVKQMKSTRDGVGIPQDVYREIKILKELSHENIVRLENVFLRPEKGEVDLVYDYAEHDLSDVIRYHRSKGACDVRIVKSIVYQILKGVAFLHGNWIMHRDLKPANILLAGHASEECGRVKIADFGLARVFQQPLRKLAKDGDVVTIWYRAPELLLGSQHYTRAIDVWAVGCIFAELLIAAPIFPGDEEKTAPSGIQTDQLRRIFAVLGRPDPAMWPGLLDCPHWKEVAKWALDEPYRYQLPEKLPMLDRSSAAFDLVSRMLAYDPNRRITAEAALKHPYFTEKPHPDANAFRTTDGEVLAYPPRRIRGDPVPASSSSSAAAAAAAQQQQQQHLGSSSSGGMGATEAKRSTAASAHSHARLLPPPPVPARSLHSSSSSSEAAQQHRGGGSGTKRRREEQAAEAAERTTRRRRA